MFKSKKWLIIGVVAAVIVLVAGVLGAVAVSAQSPTPTATSANSTPGKAFADRVAKILGVDQAKVEAAFTQAEKEMQSEAMKTRLDAMVKAGKMTQAQADQYLQWWNSRPDVQIAPMGPQGGIGGMGGMNRGGMMKGGQAPRAGFQGMPGFGKAPAAPAAK